MLRHRKQQQISHIKERIEKDNVPLAMCGKFSLLSQTLQTITSCLVIATSHTLREFFFFCLVFLREFLNGQKIQKDRLEVTNGFWFFDGLKFCKSNSFYISMFFDWFQVDLRPILILLSKSIITIKNWKFLKRAQKWHTSECTWQRWFKEKLSTSPKSE